MVLLRRALVPHGGATSSRVLIRWTSAPSHLDTWEAEDDLRRRFPDAPAWGQAVSYGGGNVRAS